LTGKKSSITSMKAGSFSSQNENILTIWWVNCNDTHWLHILALEDENFPKSRWQLAGEVMGTVVIVQIPSEEGYTEY